MSNLSGDNVKPEILREQVVPRWSRAGMFWGPMCPQDDAHEGLLDVQGTNKWFCRHSAHTGRAIYTEQELVDLEYARLTSAE